MEEIIVARLSPADMSRLRLKLCELELASSLVGLFWLPVPRALLNEVQQQHWESCGPYILALDADLESGELRLEPLARAKNDMHCECIAPASPEVIKQALKYMEDLLRELAIICLNRQGEWQA